MKYEKGRPTGIYDPEKKQYVPIADIQAAGDEKLGPLPRSSQSWKAVIGSPEKTTILANHFQELNRMDTLGAELAKSYGKRSLEIGKKLVADHVAKSEEDVNTVLLTGFYHSYGPINDYFK